MKEHDQIEALSNRCVELYDLCMEAKKIIGYHLLIRPVGTKDDAANIWFQRFESLGKKPKIKMFPKE